MTYERYPLPVADNAAEIDVTAPLCAWCERLPRLSDYDLCWSCHADEVNTSDIVNDESPFVMLLAFPVFVLMIVTLAMIGVPR